jgi:hypothetical protein
MCISYTSLDFAGSADYLEISAEWNIRFNRLIHLWSANDEINGLLIASRSMTLWCSFSLHFRWLWLTVLKTDRASAGFWKPYIIDEVPVSLNCSCLLACRYLVNKIELCLNRHRVCEVDGFVVEESVILLRWISFLHKLQCLSHIRICNVKEVAGSEAAFNSLFVHRYQSLASGLT